MSVAVVTGAGSGLGRVIARSLLGAGWQVALAGRREEPLAETAKPADSAPGWPDDAALVVSADVTSPPSVAALFDAVRDRWGRLDLLVNNAGLFGPAAQADEIDLADWQRVVDTNLTGVFLCAQHAVRMMKAQDPRGGRIINNHRVHLHQARGHRPDQVPVAGRARVRHRLRADRHRQRRNRTDQALQPRRAPGQRIHRRRAGLRLPARGRRGALHGVPAAGRERPVPHHHRDHDALHRPGVIRLFESGPRLRDACG